MENALKSIPHNLENEYRKKAQYLIDRGYPVPEFDIDKLAKIIYNNEMNEVK